MLYDTVWYSDCVKGLVEGGMCLGKSGRGVIKGNSPAFGFRGYGKARIRQDTLRRPRFELGTSRIC